LDYELAVSTPCDPSKLQALCYYAQGYYLATYDKPLFKEQYIRDYSGPLSTDIHAKYVIDSAVKEPFEPLCSSATYLFVKQIHAKFLTCKAYDIDMHARHWQKYTNLFQTISLDAMKEYFKNNFEVDLLAFNSYNPTAFISLYGKARTTITNIHEPEELVQIHNALMRLLPKEGPLEVVPDRWQHQSFKDAVLASLFYPKEYDDKYETIVYLRGIPHILFKLCISAVHKNPIAMYHLDDYLQSNEMDDEEKEEDAEDELEDEMDEDELEEYELAEEEVKVVKSDTETADMQNPRKLGVLDYNSCIPDGPPSDKYPCFRVGQLITYVRGFEEALPWFEYSNDERCKLAIALYPLDNQKSLLENLAHNHRAQVEIGRIMIRQGEVKESMEWVRKSREAGNAKAWYLSAQMAEGKTYKDEMSAAEMYIKAGDCGAISAYKHAASLVDLNKKAAILQKECDAGSPYGHENLGGLYVFHGNKEEGIKEYKKAGPAGVEWLRRLGENDAVNEIVQNHHRLLQSLHSILQQ
jgi:hypothetical protein